MKYPVAENCGVLFAWLFLGGLTFLSPGRADPIPAPDAAANPAAATAAHHSVTQPQPPPQPVAANSDTHLPPLPMAANSAATQPPPLPMAAAPAATAVKPVGAPLQQPQPPAAPLDPIQNSGRHHETASGEQFNDPLPVQGPGSGTGPGPGPGVDSSYDRNRQYPLSEDTGSKRPKFRLNNRKLEPQRTGASRDKLQKLRAGAQSIFHNNPGHRPDEYSKFGSHRPRIQQKISPFKNQNSYGKVGDSFRPHPDDSYRAHKEWMQEETDYNRNRPASDLGHAGEVGVGRQGTRPLAHEIDRVGTNSSVRGKANETVMEVEVGVATEAPAAVTTANHSIITNGSTTTIHVGTGNTTVAMSTTPKSNTTVKAAVNSTSTKAVTSGNSTATKAVTAVNSTSTKAASVAAANVTTKHVNVTTVAVTAAVLNATVAPNVTTAAHVDSTTAHLNHTTAASDAHHSTTHHHETAHHSTEPHTTIHITEAPTTVHPPTPPSTTRPKVATTKKLMNEQVSSGFGKKTKEGAVHGIDQSAFRGAVSYSGGSVLDQRPPEVSLRNAEPAHGIFVDRQDGSGYKAVKTPSLRA